MSGFPGRTCLKTYQASSLLTRGREEEMTKTSLLILM
jgi:hypothetical protein